MTPNAFSILKKCNLNVSSVSQFWYKDIVVMICVSDMLKEILHIIIDGWMG